MELAPGIHNLGGKKGGRVRAFLLDDGDELALVDTLFESDARAVLAGLDAIGRPVTDLRHIVLTHAHRSHLGGLAALKRQSGATVYAHEWEADIIAGERRAQPVTLRPTQSLRLIPFQVGLRLGKPEHVPCPVDHFVAEGDRIGPLHVLHAPGHSPGHLAFSWPERRLVLVGDAICTWPFVGAGWRAFNLNPTQHRASLRRLAELDADVVGVGHGEPITSGARALARDLVDRQAA
jgi:glyoxylase-like metal-dependent hydrolase (beta-lactamase superfamily II)